MNKAHAPNQGGGSGVRSRGNCQLMHASVACAGLGDQTRHAATHVQQLQRAGRGHASSAHAAGHAPAAERLPAVPGDGRDCRRVLRHVFGPRARAKEQTAQDHNSRRRRQRQPVHFVCFVLFCLYLKTEFCIICFVFIVCVVLFLFYCLSFLCFHPPRFTVCPLQIFPTCY